MSEPTPAMSPVLTVQGITGTVTRTEAGHAMSYFWGYKTLGIFQNQAEIDAWVNSKGVQIQPDARPGDFRYQDTDDSGTIDDNACVRIFNALSAGTGKYLNFRQKSSRLKLSDTSQTVSHCHLIIILADVRIPV